MEKRHKDIMRGLVGKLRHILVGIQTDDGFTQGNLDRELERIGVAPDGTITPVDALTGNTHNGERTAYRVTSALLTPLSKEQRLSARHEIIERAAYTWINRLLALRAMEVRNLIESTLRGEEAYGGISEKLYFLRQDEPQRTSGADGGWWAVIEDACTAQSQALPGLFALTDPNAALRPAAKALQQCIELVNGSQLLSVKGVTLDELDAVFADPDAIGWAYQFYQEEAKAAIDAKCKRGGKAASRAELAAKTQLFTEPYMVQWLLQNSLGRSYHEAYPQSTLPTTWDYYVTPETLDTAAPLSLASLTVLDPCMGSGHFLRAAFDMFVAMYREQRPRLSAKEIADTILSQHLYGIDLDPRAAQLAALTLYLRAWELVSAEQRTTRTIGDTAYIPPMMNLAATPMGLTEGALERHLQRAPQDEVFKPLLKSIFAGLEQADILGSLLRPREYLDSAIADLLKPQTIELGFNPELVARRNDIRKMAEVDPKGLRNNLLETIANSFTIEAGNTSDASVALFGREAEQGMRLLQILDRQYAVVVTNPPYLGSAYMDASLKSYVTKHYLSGKRDLYAAFILRCLELCQVGGRVAMVTMQSWMFLSSYAEIRAVSEEKLIGERSKNMFTGLLRETSIETLAQLGPHAFEEISGEVVQSAMFVFVNQIPSVNHNIVAFRLVGLRSVREKNEYLVQGWGKYVQKNVNILSLPGSPLGYWLSNNFIKIISSGANIKQGAYTKAGLTTADSIRFYRKHWEIGSVTSWLQISNGGSFKKWTGHNLDYLRWGKGWIAILKERGNKLPSLEYYSIPGVFLSQSASGCLSSRLGSGRGFTNSSLAVFPKFPFTIFDVAAWLNNHCASYIVRLYSQKMGIEAKHLDGLPLMRDDECAKLAIVCLRLKNPLVDSDLVESSFNLELVNQKLLSITTNLLSCEGTLEWRILHLLELTDLQDEIEQSTGTPAGWYPLIAGYDTLPALPDNIDIPPLPQELFDYLAEHKRIAVSDKELTRIKSNLKALYEAKPHSKGVDQEEREETADEGNEAEEEMASGAHIPIPTETFLEELSVRMELHPISVYWLLEELRAEGVRCLPEEKRLLEDRLSVLVLRLLGHRWPRQLERCS